MAEQFGVSASTVQRIWHALDIKPHRVDTFKVSGDPLFEEKLTDVFNSVPHLISCVEDYLGAHNDKPKPFVCTATAESILKKITRARTALQQVASQ